MRRMNLGVCGWSRETGARSRDGSTLRVEVNCWRPQERLNENTILIEMTEKKKSGD